jgi:hypothetical protein
MTALAPTLQAFFVSRLGRQQDASPHTIDSYRHAFRLLLAYAEAQTGKRPSGMDLADLDAVLVSGFLDHLEDDQESTVASRNTRLAAVHSFFRFASYHHPEHAETIQQVLAIPRKKTQSTPGLFSPAPRWTPSSPRPTSSPGAGVVTTCCSSWPYGPVFAFQSSPGCAVKTSQPAPLRTSTAWARVASAETPRSTNRRQRFCAPGWANAEVNPMTPCFLHAVAVGSVPTPCSAWSPNTSRPHEPPVPASRTNK